MDVVWPSIQPPWSPDANQPEQRIHTCLPSVPRLCSPGTCTGGCSIQVFQLLEGRVADNILNLPNILLVKKVVSPSVIVHAHAFAICASTLTFLLSNSCFTIFFMHSNACYFYIQDVSLVYMHYLYLFSFSVELFLEISYLVHCNNYISIVK